MIIFYLFSPRKIYTNSLIPLYYKTVQTVNYKLIPFPEVREHQSPSDYSLIQFP